jgi:hypothetical protein
LGGGWETTYPDQDRPAPVVLIPVPEAALELQQAN